MTTDPNPAQPQPADRELVEAWGVRSADGDLKGDIHDWRSRAAWDCEVYGVAKHTVVPLIAADRLTTSADIREVTRRALLFYNARECRSCGAEAMERCRNAGSLPCASRQADSVLAALRAHLEGK